jgi:hypothetical protein
MAGDEVVGHITSSPMPVNLPSDFDKTGGVSFRINAKLITDNNVAGTHHGFLQIDCYNTEEEPGSWSSGVVNLDLVVTAAQGVGSKISGLGDIWLDTDTTGADCNPNNTIEVRWTSCDTYTTGTPPAGCTSSAGVENDTGIYNITMWYLTRR